MNDLYDDVMLRRWSLDLATGREECLDDAVDVTTISPQDCELICGKNVHIHGAIAEVEAYEADNDLIVDDEIMALARLRAGKASDEDRDVVAAEWGYAVEVEPRIKISAASA